MFDNKSILITGGTGSFGQEAVQFFLKKYKKIKRLIIFSRDELKQYEMSKQFNTKKYPCIRYFIGDIRDYKRLLFAFEEVDFVIHAAALKHVSAAEYNPFEFIKTNVQGSQNIVDAALEKNVKKVIALSTDKACSPINLYGATKLCSEKIFIAANNIAGKKKTSFSVVRYGNVMNSRGSVIPLFLEQRKKKLLTITDKDMTRFNISLQKSIEMVDWAFKNLFGGEILVPIIPSYRIKDLAKAICPDSSIKIIGRKYAEKIHEELINIHESYNAYKNNHYYIILPDNFSYLSKLKKKNKNLVKIKKFFNFTSDVNRFLTIKELKKEIFSYSH